MKNSLEITKSIFDDHLQHFESADAVYVAAEREFVNFDLDHGTSDEMKAVREKLQSARDDREYYAVVLCKYLRSCKDFICFEANPDVLENSPEDVLEDVPEDSPEDAPEDVLENVLEDAPAVDPDSPLNVSEDISPAMSAKCKLCPSCVDGRCFFIPDVYDSEFPCQSPAWDNFFKSGGSHGPAP